MCLIAWNWQPHNPTTRLLLLSNRDEFYARAALPLHWWDANGAKESRVLAGKDLQGGGTWLGVSRSGRLAALTNYHTVEAQRTDAPSRGELVAGFLQSDSPAGAYLAQLRQNAANYNPFNLLVFDGAQLMGLESRGARILKMEPGIGAVSNANFHTPWPKLTRLRQALETQIEHQQLQANQLLPLLHNRDLAHDEALPRTGVPLELERALSAAFIATPTYGTRACSVVAVHADHAEFTEQSYGPQGLISQHQERFNLTGKVVKDL
ncbi:MAG: NRDE family protein [Burkholderiales bacterium]|nr:NRDE family protein [Burkholderiales bacterium]